VSQALGRATEAANRTVGDAALDAAGAVGARPHVPALHVELVVVLAAQHRGAAEAAADLEALDGSKRRCAVRVESRV